MPELPDLEVFKDNIYARLSSKRLLEANVFNVRRVNVPQGTVASGLLWKTLLGIERVGKELYFNFSDSKVVAVHLMLNGEISILEGTIGIDRIRSKIFSLVFEDQTIVFSDPGDLCTVKYMPPRGKAPDAFSEKFTLEYFSKMAAQKSWTNVKAFLIDQNIVKGIGNAYADEILWDAKISPHSIMGKIPPEAINKLYESIGSVLKNAIASIKEIAPDIISGEERSFLKVHNKNLSATATGALIKVEKIASKTTYYTDEQKLYY